MVLKFTGMSAATLQPCAGSQGEFAGYLNYEKNIMSKKVKIENIL
jgi:Glycine cleavage system protein P (pyridoxal-binding), C-terminal domain